MFVQILKAKLHQAVVTEANLYYVGSITIDSDILTQAGLHAHEKVQVVNINNGARIETYVIKGQSGSRICCLNGAAARHFHVGDRIIVMSYALIENNLAVNHQPKIVFLDKQNNIKSIVSEEIPGSEYDSD